MYAFRLPECSTHQNFACICIHIYVCVCVCVCVYTFISEYVRNLTK